MVVETDLSGKSILITGAARRVGAVMARTLHAHGANIILHYRSSASDATRLNEALNAARPGSAVTLQADLAQTAALPDLARKAVAVFGRLDVLINNASSFYPTPLGHITESQWDDLIASNLKAPLFLSQAVAPELKRTQGLILNLVDVYTSSSLRQHPVYYAAKAGLVCLTKSLARDLGPDIRVNGIAPGAVLWPEGNADDQLRQDIIARTPLKRLGTPEDVARAAVFFAKDAPFVTGQILAIDGGRSLSSS